MSDRIDPQRGPDGSPFMDEQVVGASSASPPASTATLVGKLFIVPAIVVCVMLGVAVVVILFGSSSSEKTASVTDLIQVVESDSGDRQFGMLLPSAKEAWQAAQDLALRLKDKDKEFATQAEADLAADRIIKILDKPHSDTAINPQSEDEKRGLMLRQFLLLALGQLESADAVPTLVTYLSNPNPELRRVAAQSLALMNDVPAARAAAEKVYPLVEDDQVPVRIVACLAVSALSDRGDEKAIQVVARGLEGDREVQWNAATALARLGSGRGKLVLLNMLSRSFWGKLDLDYDDGGSRVQRRFTEAEVVDRLCASIDAAAHLSDADLKTEIMKLSTSDSSPQVREAARQAIEKIENPASTKRAGMSSFAGEAASKGEVS